ncbi:MAG: LytTR family transcriptional regulator DNA-binding domain-containing protein [Clostridia bacterium]|nr:LytTR family transcriptional regulator DNA-binding domain-containing protein [Clostridia bacterium]
MKVNVFIDKNHEEEIQIFAHEKTALIEKIEELVNDFSIEIIAYNDKEIVRLNLDDIYCFITESNKLFAITEKEKLLVKSRLYNIEEKLSCDFIKINKSCIANIKKIDRFNASISGTLEVKFKNSYTEYVSRRSIKAVKERLGL